VIFSDLIPWGPHWFWWYLSCFSTQDFLILVVPRLFSLTLIFCSSRWSFSPSPLLSGSLSQLLPTMPCVVLSSCLCWSLDHHRYQFTLTNRCGSAVNAVVADTRCGFSPRMPTNCHWQRNITETIHRLCRCLELHCCSARFYRPWYFQDGYYSLQREISSLSPSSSV